MTKSVCRNEIAACTASSSIISTRAAVKVRGAGVPSLTIATVAGGASQSAARTIGFCRG